MKYEPLYIGHMVDIYGRVKHVYDADRGSKYYVRFLGRFVRVPHRVWRRFA